MRLAMMGIYTSIMMKEYREPSTSGMDRKSPNQDHTQQELADSLQEQIALVHGLVQLDSRTGRDDHEHAATLSQDFVV